MMISLIHDNCIDHMKTLDDNSIDLILTDPPYFLHGLDDTWSSQKVNSDVKNSHIKHLPKGMKFSKTQVIDLYEWYRKVSQICYCKLKPGGYFLSFSAPRLYHALAMAVELAGFEVRDSLNWIYTTGMPKGMTINHHIDRSGLSEEVKDELRKQCSGYKTPQLRCCHEPICVGMKPLIGTFLHSELNFKTGLISFNERVGNDKVPANVIVTDDFHDIFTRNFLIPKPGKEERKDNHHMTVKPLRLMKHLIAIFSKPGSLVLDPFLGSGTTAVACAMMNRRCIGIEINEDYFSVANRRVENVEK
jgi:site-specific DNA-methyltransferase (adenine-specific)